MARSKRKERPAGEVHTTVGSLGAELLGLEPPFGSAPSRCNTYFFYINKGQRFIGVGFHAAYAAKKFLDILLADDEVVKIRGITGAEDTIFATPSNIKVRCHNIDEVLEHEYTEAEEQWQLPECGNGESTMTALNFRNGPDELPESSTDESGKVVRIKREKVERPARPSKEGLTSIGEIAEELKMEPRDCRKILRDKKIEKPACGWAWSKTEVDVIKKIIHDNK